MKIGHVWIVDDNDPDVFLMQLALKKTSLPLDIRVFRNGEEALQGIDGCHSGTTECPHLLFLDLFLPQVDGGKLLDAVRNGAGFERTQVVIFSSMQDPPAGRGIDWSTLRYLKKPSELNSFTESIMTLAHETFGRRGDH